MLGSNWGTCYCSLGMFGKYLNTALMINKYWEHSPETGLCVEESINCQMSGDWRGMWRYWQSLLLYRCTARHWARTAGCKYLFFLWKLDQQSRWKEGMSHISICDGGGWSPPASHWAPPLHSPLSPLCHHCAQIGFTPPCPPGMLPHAAPRTSNKTSQPRLASDADLYYGIRYVDVVYFDELHKSPF